MAFDWRAEKAFDTLVSPHAGSMARAAEIILCPRLRADGSIGRHEIEEVVFASGRPVIGLPAGWKGEELGGRVLVAWDGGREAARAVFDALPLLRGPRRSGSSPCRASSTSRFASSRRRTTSASTLSRHGVKVEAQSFAARRGSVKEELQAQALEFGADMTVMGCYGHSRFRERILGGVSRDMLKDMPGPLLLGELTRRRCWRWCSRSRASRSLPPSRATPEPGRRAGARPGRGLRRLPHRPARRRRRASRHPLPIVPGHEIVGRVDALGPGVAGFAIGERVGIPWLGRTCGACAYCRVRPREPLRRAGFTGYTLDGGYADYAVADAALRLPAPGRLLRRRGCAAALRRADRLPRARAWPATAEHLGIYGFGAAAHIVAQVARHQGREVYAFTRPGDRDAQRFARELGADWAGGSDEAPPRAARRGDHLRAGRQPGAGGARAPCARAAPSSAAAST